MVNAYDKLLLEKNKKNQQFFSSSQSHQFFEKTVIEYATPIQKDAALSTYHNG